MRRLGGVLGVTAAALALAGGAWAAAAPANDAFADAQVVTGSSGSAGGSNVGATREAGEPQITGNAGGQSVWFRWTAPATGQATVDTVGSSFDTLLGVYTGSAVGSLALVAENDDIDTNAGAYQSRVTFNATAGTVYSVAVDGWHSNRNATTSNGSVQLNWSVSGAAPPPPPASSGPPNDLFANAQPVSGASATGSTVGATRESGEPQIAGNAGGQSIWFTWTAPASGTATVDTVGSSFDTLLGVYTGNSVSALTTVAQNDDLSSSTLQSRVTFSAAAGATYRIAVDGYHSGSRNTTAAGAVTLNIAAGAAPPPSSGVQGDAFAQAIGLTGPSGSASATTVGATKETGEPAHATDAGGHSIWFRWTAPSNGTVSLSLAGSGFDTTLAVYTGTAVGSLAWVASNDDASPTTTTSALVFSASAGTTYSIAVDGYGGANGPVRLGWQTGAQAPLATGDPVLAVAGDVHAGCGSTQAEATAETIDASGANVVVANGDVTDNGGAYQLTNCFGATWNRFGARLRPVLGNHEFDQAGAGPSFDFFGARLGTRGQGWYSFDSGTWHVVVLNSNCSKVGGCGAGSAQLAWLKSDLAAHPEACTLAIWHHPLFTSVPEPSGNDQSTAPLWQALDDAGADVVVNAHSRSYERFAPQTATGAADPAHGIREFIAGTGGGELDGSRSGVAANSEAWNGTVFGVLQLTLRPGSYDWRYLPSAGGAYADSGSASCH